MTVSLTKTKYLNIYELDRCFGGPEEGGWWYTAGTLLSSTEVPADANADELHYEADAKCAAENGQLKWNLYSVNYRGGYTEARLEDTPGADFPAETPHYE